MNIDEPDNDDFYPASKIMSALEYLCNIGSSSYIPQSIKAHKESKLEELCKIINVILNIDHDSSIY